MKGGISVDWNKIKAEYISGGTSYRKLAKKYAVSLQTLSETARRQKWTELRKQTQDKTNTKIVEKTATKQATSAVLISDTTEKILHKVALEVTNGEIDRDKLEAYKIAMDILRKGKDIVGMKSEIDLEEQTARIEKLRKEAKEDKTDTTVNVVLGDAKEFCV